MVLGLEYLMERLYTCSAPHNAARVMFMNALEKKADEILRLGGPSE